MVLLVALWAASVGVTILLPGAVVRRTVASDDPHRYQINLAPLEFIAFRDVRYLP